MNIQSIINNKDLRIRNIFSTEILNKGFYKVLGTIFCIVLIIGIFNLKAIDHSKLVEKNGLVYKKSNNKLYTGNFIQKKEGIIIRTGGYKKGKVHGKFITFYKSGNKESEIYYKNGKVAGPIIKWYKNGNIEYEIEKIIDNKEHGKCRTWYKDGQIGINGNYFKGKKDGKWTTWYENGQIKTRQNYNNGISDGKFTYWFSNGNKKNTGYYDNGFLNGKYKEWHENGRLYVKGYYKNNKMHGKWKLYDENGYKKEEDSFNEGKKTSSNSNSSKQLRNKFSLESTEMPNYLNTYYYNKSNDYMYYYYPYSFYYDYYDY